MKLISAFASVLRRLLSWRTVNFAWLPVLTNQAGDPHDASRRVFNAGTPQMRGFHHRCFTSAFGGSFHSRLPWCGFCARLRRLLLSVSLSEGDKLNDTLIKRSSSKRLLSLVTHDCHYPQRNRSEATILSLWMRRCHSVTSEIRLSSVYLFLDLHHHDWKLKHM